MTDYTIAVVQDAVRVLDAFNQQRDGRTLTEIVNETGLGKNKVFRLLSTLEGCRMVYRDENGKFHLGFHLAELAQNVQVHHLLLDVSRPIMGELLQKTRESIFLGVPSEHNALCIAALESTRSVRLYARVGIQAPLYIGGAPKVLLAFLDPAERERHLRHFAANDIKEVIDWIALRDKLAEIRRLGYAITVDELDPGAHSVSAPIFDFTGAIVAGLSIAGPSIRFPADKVDAYIQLIKEATSRISASLGYNAQTAIQRDLQTQSVSNQYLS